MPVALLSRGATGILTKGGIHRMGRGGGARGGAGSSVHVNSTLSLSPKSGAKKYKGSHWS